MTPATTGGLQGRPSLSWVYHSTNANVFELLCVDAEMRFRFSREVELQQPGRPVQSVRPLPRVPLPASPWVKILRRFAAEMNAAGAQDEFSNNRR
jgi:hypothetical protein